jgi:hypothetical protein
MHTRTSTARRNLFIRSVATVAGDVAIGYAMASTCVWIVHSAALGLFLTFLLWLLAIALALALSQYVLHPAVAFALSDRKLDRGIAALSDLAQYTSAGAPLWQQLRRGLTRFAAGQAAT